MRTRASGGVVASTRVAEVVGAGAAGVAAVGGSMGVVVAPGDAASGGLDGSADDGSGVVGASLPEGVGGTTATSLGVAASSPERVLESRPARDSITTPATT